MPFGAAPGPEGVRFRLWAPARGRVELELGDTAYAAVAADACGGGGWFELVTHQGAPRYALSLSHRRRARSARPRRRASIPATSMARARSSIRARSNGPTTTGRAALARGGRSTSCMSARSRPTGTFRGVRERLDYLVALGVTAIELMPLADFPGARNWGYDGVLPFAPDASYGTPDELKALVAAAHARGLMVLIDVVYNHFGPEGNYLPRVAPPFFTDRHRTPWGAALNFDGPRQPDGARLLHPQRALLARGIPRRRPAARRRARDRRRLDARLPDRARARACAKVPVGTGMCIWCSRTTATRRADSRATAKRRPLPYTAQWNDDFHHVAHHLVDGRDAAATTPTTRASRFASLGRCLAEGFAYQGERVGVPQRRRGAASRVPRLPPEAFVNFLQNHDQVGNRAFGDRLHRAAPAGALRRRCRDPAARALRRRCCSWARSSAPPRRSCSSATSVASCAAVRAGRRADSRGFQPFDDEAGDPIPDPGARQHSPAAARLDSIAQDPHASWLAAIASCSRCAASGSCR